MRKRLPIKERPLPSALSFYPSSLLAFIFCLLSLVFTYCSYQSLKQNQSADDHRYQAYLLATQLYQGSDQLTLMARSYAVTGEKQYLDSYNEILDIRNGKQSSPHYYQRMYWDMLLPENGISPFPEGSKKSMKQLMLELQLPDNEVALLIEAKAVSNQLSKIEFEAFLDVKSGLASDIPYLQSTQREVAISLLYSDAYAIEKSIIRGLINDFFDLQEPRSFNEITALSIRHHIFVTLTTICYLLLILFLLYNLYKQSKNKGVFVRELRKEVSNRTLELFEKREQLKVVIHEMELTKNQLVESEKMASLGNLVSGVAHEVNTPLGISVTLGSYLQDDVKRLQKKVEKGALKKSELDKYCVESIDNFTLLLSNLDRAANLISSFKQVAVDQSSDEVRVIKMSDYINEVLLSLHPIIKKSNVEIKVIAPENESLINTYPGAIAQIVTNLVMNALIHAFDDGCENGKVGVLLAFQGEYVQVTICDNGKGMQESVAVKVFEPFFTTQRGNGGSGLGMSIVYNLVVHQLSGSIKCKSKVDEGTSFSIRFPVKVRDPIQKASTDADD